MTDPIDLMSQWWEYYQPDSRANYSDILSGMRRFVPGEMDSFSGGKTEKIVNYQKQTASCQYWVKGLSAVCEHWDGAALKCTVDAPDGSVQPSGYGIEGGCDRLGRRSWCSQYKASDDDNLEQFVCIAPCIEKSGLGRQITTETKTLLYRPLNPDEIKGYNPDDNGVGQCDGWGMGRGDKGPFSRIEDVYNVMPVCRHYRPQQMGFGAIQPRPFHGSDKPGKPFDSSVNWLPDEKRPLHDGSKADPLTKMEVRLPFIFQMYNSMSMYQKCAHWEATSPAFFIVDYIGADPSMFCIQMSDESYCKCKDSGCNDYKNIKDEWTEGLPWLLTGVWAPYGGIVCNGAKPECPCYSGKWIYCIDNRMRDGMSITADQIFELRFWASNWYNQAEYDAYYLQKPGPTRGGSADESTADIYTFTKWKEDAAIHDPNMRIMEGKLHHMCMPAPLNMREFDVATYITKKDYTYPALNTNTGTHAEGIKASFPTLARELEATSNYTPDILVIYPYATIDPWSILACSDENQKDYCYHDSNLMEDPLISVVGRAVLKKTVYVINKTITSNISAEAFGYMNTYVRANQIPKTKLRDFSESMASLIKRLEEEATAIFFSSADNYGFFEVSRVTLKLNELNELYVVCKWKDGDLPQYSYRKVKVKSRYWAGLIEQKSAEHTHEGDIWYNYFPNFYYPSFYNISGYVHTTLGEVQTVFSTYALYEYGTVMDIAYYAYCINEYTEKDENVQKWVQVGATGYIWGEIDNNEISYLWPFAITKATISLNSAKDSKDPVYMCGSNASSITLEVVYPETLLSPGISIDRNAEIIRRAIPPNAFLLKAPEPLPFFNKDWTLSIEYAYQRIDTFMGEKVVWPYNMGTEWGLNMFAQSPYQVMHTENENAFQIAEVGGLQTRGSMKVMAYISDEKKRVQAAVSTKLLLQGYNGGCRSVDIFYRYSVDAASYDLEPAYGFFTWRGAPVVNSNSTPAVHSRTAKCGDHECAPGNCIGPMWFPFKNCTTVEFYNIQNGAAECTMPISEASPNLAVMGFAGWRYVIADRFNAWVTTGGNWASSCGTPWYYHYSMAGDTQRFVGYGNKKAKVDKWYYSFMSWALPPFGNKGRAFVERYVTRDFASFIDFSVQPPRTSFEYMPMVFDKEDLFADLNPFANPDEATPLHEPFSHFSMLSNYVSEFISEQVSKERYRFDEIIEPVYHGNCMYPYPVMGSGQMTRVIRYGFKNTSHVWAWPEFWKPLERNKDSSLGQFRFLDLSRPEYYFDYNKVEHRLITDEGSHILIFEPPKKSSKSGGDTDDSDASIYPSIAIDGKYPRYFKLLYDDYSAENVEWKDEATTGEEGASGGDGEGEGGNIYELANNGAGLNGLYVHTEGTQWLHDFNTLFDANASAEPNEERKAYLGKSIFTGEDVYLYYNRGLIAFIARNRLKYLPIELSDVGPPLLTSGYMGDKTLESFSGYWEIDTEEDITGVPLLIEVSGYWGKAPLLDEDGNESIAIYSMPGIEVIEGEGKLTVLDENGFPVWPEDGRAVDSMSYVTGRDISITGLTEFKMEFELPRTPDRMVSSIGYFIVRLTAYPTEVLNLTSITAQIGKYVRAEEELTVWERRYYAGIGSLPETNADGPDSKLYRSYDRDMKNAGQYFPFEDTFEKTYSSHEDGTFLDDELTNFEEGGKVISKLNMVGFTKIYRTDEKLDITMDNLKEKELEPQRELHEEFFNQDDHDTLNYVGVNHPGVEGWLKQINAPMMRASSLALTYKKIDWDHNEYKNMLNQDGEFITPGGHYFIWSDNFFRTRCYYFGGIMNVYKVGWVHERHAHGGGLNTEGDIETTWETGMAYAGWGRLHYYNGLFNVLGFLGQRDSIAGQQTGVVTGMNTDKYS